MSRPPVAPVWPLVQLAARTVKRLGHPAGHLALYIAKVRLESNFMCTLMPGAQMRKAVTLPLLYSYTETGNVLYLKRKVEALLCNHCCRGKAISITYCE